MQVVRTPVKIPEEFKALFDKQYRYILFHGGRGSLKSHSVARSLILRGRQDKLRILCTREIQRTIADSVHKLLKDIINLYDFNDYAVTDKTIKNVNTGTEFIFAGLRQNITEIKSMEGIDICWVEEAQSITEASLDILTPTIRKPGSQIIFTFNRFAELDPVYVRFVLNKPPKTYVGNVNYKIAEDLGWLPDVLKLELEIDKANPSLFAHKWMGEPLAQGEMSIISRDTILEAMRREIKDDGAIEIGVDVARMGSDRTVFWKRKGLASLEKDFKVLNKLRTTQICDQLEKFAEFNKEILLKIDDTGVGGGVTDEMIKRGYNVMPINFGAKPVDKDKYPNWISEAWFYMSDIMPTIQLPFNSDLLMELSTRQWSQDTKGKRSVESKQQYKKRGFRSPDLADACIICYYTPQIQPVEYGGAEDM